uniref:RNA helicase n=1 Tax=Phallusia mammillata TaxID=59560 RepID=A0A6F9DAU6_9ASCI|nr:probable ATP-dependent RNA helicase DHX58 [Phallusia mammillata]
MLREKLVTISEFTLLIIDECHHTVKDDPYNNIMKIYLDKRLDASSDVSLPQIVGLTASPGMGKAKKMSQAEENIKTLMANLDVTKAPTQVNLSTRNLKTFQNETRDQTISILRAPDDDFRQSISKSMDEIETLLEKEINLHQNDLGGEIKFNLHARKGSQDYEAWVITLRNRSKTLANDDLSHKLMMFAEHLLAYNTALVLNDHVRSSDAEDQLFELMEKYKSENPVVLRLRQIYDTNKVEPLKQVNDLLLKLHKVLLDEFSRQNDSRCIIFVRTRSIAGGVITYMEEEQDLMKFGLNPKLLTGAGVSGDKGGMTKREQESTLGAFRQGKCKVIVATSVAEEGLDIQACNLIITYNYSTNEVGHVQRKGRGRAANSQIVTLAYDDSGHVQKERENKIRVELTEEMLGTIRGIPPKTLKDQIREIQIKAKKERDLERKIKARLKPRKKSDEIFNLQCLWCKQHATTTQHLRHINKQHRVIVDPGFVQRAVFKTEKDPQKWKRLADDHFVTGKMFCANQCCRNHLGYRMKHKHLTLSVPKVTCFLFTDQSGSRETFEKWSQVTFKVNELNEQDLAELLPLGNLDNEIEDVDYD